MPIVSVAQDIKDQKNFLLFHDGSNHDYHFIIKELAEGFESLSVYEETQRSTRYSLYQS